MFAAVIKSALQPLHRQKGLVWAQVLSLPLWVGFILPPAGQHALCPFVTLWHTERYLNPKLLCGNKHREPKYLHGHKSGNTLSRRSTWRADSWPYIPPGRECSFSGASPSCAADGNEVGFYWRYHITIKSTHCPFMGKTALYSMMIIFQHFCEGKYPFLYKLVAIIENGCPSFTR